MHGTGTSLGDPIEVGAAHAVLGRAAGTPLVLEAVKSYVGHTVRRRRGLAHEVEPPAC